MRSPRTRPCCILATLLVATLAQSGCEKPSHANIDKWRSTDKGPGKLLDALGKDGLDPDLRAHAAQALVAIEKAAEVKVALTAPGLSDKDRAEILAKLVVRLWNDAKLTDDVHLPTAAQVRAKDALFMLRALAAGPDRDEIDGYLVDWLTGGGHFQDLRALGEYHGELVVRTIGAKAAPKLMAAARALAADPADGKSFVIVPDDLLLGIAYTGAPDAVGFLVDLAEKEHHDDTLAQRAIGALYVVFVVNKEPPLVDPAGLRPHVPRFKALAKKGIEYNFGELANPAFELLAQAGKPDCIAPLVELAHLDSKVARWEAVQMGLRCAGADGVVPMAEALPQDDTYELGILEKYFWDKIVEVGPGVAAPARTLLGSQSWVARLTGIHVIARVGGAKDAAELRKLAKDPVKARGWWGEPDDKKEKKKPEPTLGELALAAANKLEKKP